MDCLDTRTKPMVGIFHLHNFVISLTVLMWPTDHYLYFRGIPNPPDAYIPPIGASVNTWPNIYNNLLDIDFCVVRCCSIDLFKTICKLRFCRITLIIWATA